MELKLKELQLDYFKGVQHRVVTLKEKGDTSIVGDNRSGKTTIFDAYSFAWTGKDSLGRKTFGIKTRVNGKTVHKCDYKVTARFEADGKPLEVQRVINEVWRRKNGSEEEELAGHETHYFINGLEKKTQKEFDAELAQYVGADDFALLSDVTYFFRLTPADQKRMLFTLVRPVTDEEVLEEEPQIRELEELIGDINEALHGMTIEAYGIDARDKRSILKKELESIPTKIAAKQEDLPEVEDWDEVQGHLEEAKGERAKIDGELSDMSNRENSRQSERIAMQKKIGDKKAELVSVEAELKRTANAKRNKCLDNIRAMEDEKSAKQRKIERATKEIADKRKDIERHEAKVAKLERELEEKRKEFFAIRDEEFSMPTDATVCPTCLRPLDPSVLKSKEAELLARFNEDKSFRLSENKTKGAMLKNEQAVENQYIADYTAEIEELEEGIKVMNENIETLTADIAHEKEHLPEEVSGHMESEDTRAINEEIAELERQAEEKSDEQLEDNTELIKRKTEVNALISELDGRMANKTTYERIMNGIRDLQKQQLNINKELAKADRVVELVDLFIKTKDQMLIDRINSLFQVVKFNFLSQRLNGNDNITCECTVGGVEIKDVNNADRINAGLDIINAFCRAKDIYIPIFVDNAEGVQRTLSTRSQKVLLYVKQEVTAGDVDLNSNSL